MNTSLLHVPLCNVVLDELHLMLRVTGEELLKIATRGK